MITRQLTAFVVVVATSVATSLSHAGEPVLLGRNIPAAERLPAERIDHSAWDALLKKYVDERGMVNYAGWKASTADVQALDDYLSQLSTASAKVGLSIPAHWKSTVRGLSSSEP